MEEYDGLVKRLIRCLNGSGLDYAFTGALAVSYYGFPRTTSDVDVLVAIEAGGGGGVVVEALRCVGLDVDEKRIDKAVVSDYKIVTLNDRASPYSVDVIISPDKLEKRSGYVAGLETFLQEPEGLVSAKLRMIKATLPRERAMKDEEDVESILRFTHVDLEAVRRSAKKDKTLDILENLLRVRD